MNEILRYERKHCFRTYRYIHSDHGFLVCHDDPTSPSRYCMARDNLHRLLRAYGQFIYICYTKRSAFEVRTRYFDC